jgi:hypothetical protein
VIPRFRRRRTAAVALHGERLTHDWQPLFEQVPGEAAHDEPLVRDAFVTRRAHLTGDLIGSSIAETTDDHELRELLINGVACAIRMRVRAQGFVVS